MSLVMNEYEWAEYMLNNHNLGKKPVETLSRVANYYYENKYKKREIRSLIETFLVKCDPHASPVQWSNTLDRVMRNVGKYQLIRVEGIDITENEMSKISALSGKQIRRLAFTLLCVAKYWNAVSESNNGWVNTSDKEIMQMANINTSIKRQSMMFAELKTAGLVRFSKKIDNLNVQIVFMEQGEIAMHIHDFRNLGYQYLRYCGEPFFECVNCGITVKAQALKGRKQKYCPSCALEQHTRQKVESVMRQRDARKSLFC